MKPSEESIKEAKALLESVLRDDLSTFEVVAIALDKYKNKIIETHNAAIQKCADIAESCGNCCSSGDDHVFHSAECVQEKIVALRIEETK